MSEKKGVKSCVKRPANYKSFNWLTFAWILNAEQALGQFRDSQRVGGYIIFAKLEVLYASMMKATGR
jgi:hypothetical protein